MKKIILFIISITLIVGSISCPVVQADEKTAKVVYVNVAHGKEVYSAATQDGSILTNGFYLEGLTPDHCEYKGADVYLPGGTVLPGATDVASDWHIVDLGRRYNIDEIRLYGCGDGSWDDMWMTHFSILVSNSITFDSDDTLEVGGIEDSSANYGVNSAATPFVAELDGTSAYRYVMLKKTDSTYYGYGEIEVYANQTVTQVEGPFEVSTNPESIIEGEKAVNGTNEDDSDAWVHDGAEDYNYLSVDLGEARHIGMIEVEGRNLAYDNSITRQVVGVYGSNDISNLSKLEGEGFLSEEEGYKKLIYVGGEEEYPEDLFPFPKYPGMLKKSVNDGEAYRYFTIRKTEKFAAAVGEVRFFEVNPEVLSVSVDNSKLCVNFSDEMSQSTASAENISLIETNTGNYVTTDFVPEDKYTYSTDISGLDSTEGYTLVIDKAMTNAKGVALAEDYVSSLGRLDSVYAETVNIYGGTDCTGKPIKNLIGQEGVSFNADVTNLSSKSCDVMAIMALYDKEGSLKGYGKEEYTLSTGESKTVSAFISFDDALEDGMYIKTFVWQSGDGALRPLTKAQKIVYDKLYEKYSIYVSPKGNDGGLGTADSPYRTIERAQREVRELRDDMNMDITVNLMGGLYTLSDTLEFTEEDSGLNGHDVNYTAFGNQEVIISGGRKLSSDSWTLYDKENNIYAASISGINEIRDLYVDGRRARSARTTGRIRPLGFCYADDGETPLGYRVSSDDVGIYDNASDIRLFTTQVWQYTMCNVDSITKGDIEGENHIIMEPDAAFKVASTDAPALFLDGETSFYLENAYELLDEEGEFYFDKDDSVLYYKPADGEGFDNVYVPLLDKLVTVTGSSMDNKAHNICFSGITFAHTVHADIDKGYVGGQAQTIKPIDIPNSAHPLDNTTVGANIRVIRSEDIRFEDNIFTGLGAVALGVYEGSNDIVIRGNVFYDIGDSAVTVGLPSDAYMDEAVYDENGNYIGTNVALCKNITTNSQERDLPGYNGNDGDPRTVTVMNTDSDYWQVDLGMEYTIKQIRVKSRKEYGSDPDVYEPYVGLRRNFKVMGSNYEDFSDGGKVLAEQGSDGFDFDTGFIGEVNDTEKYRYIRIQKTVSEHFPMADLEVISSDTEAPIREVSKRTVIDNNYITRIGEFNLGAPGIQLYYTEAAQVSNNYIKDVPYSGICAGWGWLNTLDSTTAKNNKILQNKIENYATRTYDAGGVYLLGAQSGNQVDGNYLKNQPNAFEALYLDSGADTVELTNNVSENVPMVFMLGAINETTDKENLTIKNNYSTSGSFIYNPENGETSDVDDPILYLVSTPPQTVTNIISASGLSEEYTHLISLAPEGRWSLSTEDIYGDVIDHHRSREGGSIGESMPDSTLIYYYLSNLIRDAKNILALGEGLADDSEYQALDNAIDTATSERISYSSEVNLYGSTDRSAVIETRINLINAINRYTDSISKSIK